MKCPTCGREGFSYRRPICPTHGVMMRELAHNRFTCTECDFRLTWDGEGFQVTGKRKWRQMEYGERSLRDRSNPGGGQYMCPVKVVRVLVQPEGPQSEVVAIPVPDPKMDE